MKITPNCRMKKGVLHIPSDGICEGGAFGEYFRISRDKGVKVILSGDSDIAEREAKYMRLASKHKIGPKVYSVVRVKYRAKLYYGIVNQYLGTRTADYDNESTISKRLYGRLEKIGIYHSDLTRYNFRKFKRRWYVIDFSPDCLTYEKPRKK